VAQEIQAQQLLVLKAYYATLPAGRDRPAADEHRGRGRQLRRRHRAETKLWIPITSSSSSIPMCSTPPTIRGLLSGRGKLRQTVNTTGDGKTAITNYLAGGGTLVMLASGPRFPFYYGYGPATPPGRPIRCWPLFGIPIQGFESPPSPSPCGGTPNQTILHPSRRVRRSPSGDQRLARHHRQRINPANRYQSFITRRVPTASTTGDAAGFLAVSDDGQRKNGKIVYVMEHALASPQGPAIMGRHRELGSSTPRCVRPRPFQLPSACRTTPMPPFNSMRRSNLDYILQYRNAPGAGPWTLLNEYSPAPTNRSIWYTNNIGGVPVRFYRQMVGP